MNDLALAWRLARGAWRKLVLLAVCVAIGVAARAAVGTVAARAEQAIAREARPLLGGDLVVTTRQALSQERQADLDRLLPDGARQATMVELTTMATTDHGVQLVELAAIGNGYPLLPVPTHAPAFAGDPPGCVVQASLCERLRVRIGDTLRLGSVSYRIAALLDAGDPALGTSPFALGPRVVISLDSLAATGLTATGARLTWERLVVLPDPATAPATAQRLAEAWELPAADRGFGGRGIGDDGIQVFTARQAMAGLERALGRFSEFLRLTALGALLLSAVGVAALSAAAIRSRADELAVLAALGCAPRRAARLLLIQILAAALVGSLVGALAGGGLAALALVALRHSLPMATTPLPDWWSLIAATLAGLLTSGLAALVPLAAIHALSPLAVLRDEAPTLRGGWRATRRATCGLLALAGFAAIDSGSPHLGPLTVLAVGVTGVAAWAIGGFALRLISRWRLGPPGIRLGLAALGNHASRPAIAVAGLALAAALLTVPLIQRASLAARLDPTRHGALPDLFAIDIQPDQLAAFTAAAHDAADSAPIGLSPMVTARYLGLAAGSPNPPSDNRDRFFRDREQRLSWRHEPSPDERTIAGRWPRDAPSAEVHGKETSGEASLDAEFAERLGVGLGSVLRFDVQGDPLTVTVVGLRDVDFLALRPNFFILVNPAALHDAPQTWIAAISAPTNSTEISRAIALATPGVTVIDLGTITREVGNLMTRLVQALGAVALFSVAGAAAVLAGLVNATARERRADGALIRALGGRTTTLWLMTITEFSALGLTAGMLGVTAGVAGSALLLANGSIPLHLPWVELLSVISGTLVITASVGVLSVRSAWQARPAA